MNNLETNANQLSTYVNVWSKRSEANPDVATHLPIYFKKTTPDAILPTASYGNSGLDLFVDQDTVLEANSAGLVNSGVCLAWLWPGMEAQIRPRSSTLRRGIHVALGTIDNGYRGELLVSAWNLTGNPILLKKGERIAQLVIAPYTQIGLSYEVAEVTETDRGDKGFGSSGK